MQIHHHRVLHYTLAGAVSGASSTGLGAVMLHPADPNHFPRAGAAVAGLVGGAATHAGLGLLAAFSGDKSRRHELAHVATSSVLSGLTSGIVGGAILGAAGYPDHPPPGHAVLAGLVGGVSLAVVGGMLTGALCLARWGFWCGEKVTAGAEHLLERADSSRDLEEA